MALDHYAPCLCGSGKKYRWCCEPIDKEVRRAMEQEDAGQHETALRTMEAVVAAHPDNPQAWGQQAQLLSRNGKIEEAEAALEKAFALNPNYPFGLFLRAIFRYQEGEIGGALLLARRAADAYDPQAHEQLGQVYALIVEFELAHNRPIAAREAFRRVLHYLPQVEEQRQRFELIFGEKSSLPFSARRDYRAISPKPPSEPARLATWTSALGQLEAGKLSAIVAAFEALTASDANDAAAWYYLGLSRAWLGDNLKSLDAFDRYLDLDTDLERKTAIATLQEVLRAGQGAEEVSDYCEWSFLLQIRDAQTVNHLLQDWSRARRLVPLQSNQENTFTALLLETNRSGLLTAGSPGSDAGHFAAYLLIAGSILRVTSSLREPFNRLKDEVRQRLSLGVTELHERRGPIQFQDVVSEALLFPLGGNEQQAQERVIQHLQHFYEQTWPQRTRKALAGKTPLEAVATPLLKTKLLGVIGFLEECSKFGMVANYDFGRLRKHLGLLETSTKDAAAAIAVGIQAALDIPNMDVTHLTQIAPESLTIDQLEQAWQVAQKLEASDQAVRFAKALVGRPASDGKPDRYSLFNFLITRALADGERDGAVDYVNEGEKFDCEANEGHRRNDFELRRAQVHVKRGEPDAARDVFQRLIDRVPDEMRFRTTATEAMLSLRQPATAVAFAQAGLEAARKKNDRDAVGHLEELEGAAKKQLG